MTKATVFLSETLKGAKTMCKVYGYCRISTKEQNIERQERNILAEYKDAIIVREAFTGTKIEGRKAFLRLLQTAKAGDTIVFDSVSRMSRDAADGFKLYESLYNNNVNLVFLKEPQINTATYKAAMETQFETIKTGNDAADELTASIMAAVKKYMMRLADEQIRLAFSQSQKEVDYLHQRTREGMETARLKGKQIGQRAGAKLTVKKAAPAKEKIRENCKAFGGSLSDADCMKLAGVSKPTYYKYKKEIAEEMGKEAEQIRLEIDAGM